MSVESEAMIKTLTDELTSSTRRIEELQSQLAGLNNDLAKAKVGKRSGIKKAIRNVEQQLNHEFQIKKKTEENLSETQLALQGIDQKSGVAGAIGGAIGDVAGAVAAGFGAGGSALGGASSALNPKPTMDSGQTKKANDDTNQDKKPNYLIYIIGGALLLILLMFRKK
ncbi:MAG: hypothetical protein EBZ58_13025 [Bacteroidetes bacterium]|nr:hypothetical protein [Bacteroidota bacterium]